MNNTMKQKRIMASVAAFLFLIAVNAEDGSNLWLRMQHETNTAKIETNDKSATGKTAANELTAFWKGGDVTLKKDGKMPDNDGFSISKSAKDGSIVVKARRSAGHTQPLGQSRRQRRARICRQKHLEVGRD